LEACAPKTVNNVLTVLNTLLKRAVEWGERQRLPCTIKLLPNPKKTMGFHDFDQHEVDFPAMGAPISRRRRLVRLPIVITICVMHGCARQSPPSTAAVSGVPFVIVESAREVRRTSEYDGAVYYLVEDPYPGSVIINEITRRIEMTPGWQASGETPINAEGNDFRSWGNYYESSGAKVYQWIGSWKDLHGDLLTYVLRYEVADPNAVAHTMEVSAIYMTAATVASMRNARGPH